MKVLLKEQSAKDVLNNEIVVLSDFSFDRLVVFRDDFYVEAPPFDHVLVFDSGEKSKW